LRVCRECNRIKCEERYRKFREANPLPEKTHCLRGHPLSGDNLSIRLDKKTGQIKQRRCKACAALYTAQYRQHSKNN
jgi:hypothetical protein